jgi:hypothetical protein
MLTHINGQPIDKSDGANARTLATILNGLMTLYTNVEIIELLKPSNVEGGLKILNEQRSE